MYNFKNFKLIYVSVYNENPLKIVIKKFLTIECNLVKIVKIPSEKCF